MNQIRCLGTRLNVLRRSLEYEAEAQSTREPAAVAYETETPT